MNYAFQKWTLSRWSSSFVAWFFANLIRWPDIEPDHRLCACACMQISRQNAQRAADVMPQPTPLTSSQYLKNPNVEFSWFVYLCPDTWAGCFFLRPGIGLETLGSVKNRAIHPRSSDFRPHFADYSKSRDLPAVIHGYSSLAQEATTRLWWIDKSATWWTQTPCPRRS